MPNILVKGHLVQVFVCTHRDTHTHTHTQHQSNCSTCTTKAVSNDTSYSPNSSSQMLQRNWNSTDNQWQI